MSQLVRSKEPNIYLDKISGNFFWREKIDGVNYCKSTGEKTIGAAKTQVQKFRSNLKLIQEDKNKIRFDNLWEVLLEVQSTKSARTLLMAENQVNKYLRPWFAKNCPLVKGFEKSFEEIWARYVQDQKKINSTRKLEHDRRHLVMALHRAYNKGWVSRPYSKSNFPLNEASQSIGRHIDDEELKCVLAQLKSEKKLKLQILMALTMGMRKSEILELKVEEVDLQRSVINLDPKRLKIRRERKVPIPIAKDVFFDLKAWVEQSHGVYVFPQKSYHIKGRPINFDTPQSDLGKCWRNLKVRGVINFRFHDLRHTAITNMIAQGIPLSTVSKIVGASEKVVNKIYDHVSVEMNYKIKDLFEGRFV